MWWSDTFFTFVPTLGPVSVRGGSVTTLGQSGPVGLPKTRRWPSSRYQGRTILHRRQTQATEPGLALINSDLRPSQWKTPQSLLCLKTGGRASCNVRSQDCCAEVESWCDRKMVPGLGRWLATGNPCHHTSVRSSHILASRINFIPLLTSFHPGHW